MNNKNGDSDTSEVR